jgi:general secretion pathway protein D
MNHTRSFRPTWQVLGPAATLLFLLAGCAHIDVEWPAAGKTTAAAPAEAPATNAAPVMPTPPQERTLAVSATPNPPAGIRTENIKPDAAKPNLAGAATITLSFEQISLPAFIQTVYGTLLKQNIALDPAIAQRKELVTLRAGKEQSPADVFNTARVLLKTYGVAIVDTGAGLLRAIPDTAIAGYAPEIRRGRAAPEVPLPMRPVYQLLEMQSLRASDVSNTLRTMFKDRITIIDDGLRNALLITGQNDDVLAAMEAIQVLDQPLMRGRASARLTPGFWPVEDLAKRLTEILTAEGYFVGGPQANSASIVLIPVSAVNALIVFAADQPTLNHVAKWAAELDKPNAAARPSGGGYFTYHVRHTDASTLAKTLAEILGSGPAAAPQRATVPTGSSAADLARAQAELDRQAAARGKARVVVNTPTNSLIFQGTADDYSQLIPILQELDRPTKQALIEVTVMDVTLDDSTALGFQWSAETTRGGSRIVADSTFPGPGSFVLSRLNTLGQITARLTALASDGKATLVSNPRIMAKNGETATIQVGQEVPTLSSTLGTAGNTGTTGSTVVQTVVYKNVGTILTVKPVIYSNDRIDLEVSQEVSDIGSTGVGGSPAFNTSRITSKLTLKDGEPILIGGLIRTSSSDGSSGIPFLKNLPGVGHAFKNTSVSTSRRELVLLITPYIVSDASDAQRITEEFRRRLGEWAR